MMSWRVDDQVLNARAHGGQGDTAACVCVCVCGNRSIEGHATILSHLRCQLLCDAPRSHLHHSM
jgi:hypothetical protein